MSGGVDVLQGRQDGRRACVFNPQAPVGLGWHPLVAPDEGVFDPKDVAGFIKGAKSRFWEREPKLRTLA